MNPETGRFEPLKLLAEQQGKQVADLERRSKEAHESQLVRPDGSVVPPHWAVYTAGELVVLKEHTFKVAYINECTLVLEPVRPETALDGTNI